MVRQMEEDLLLSSEDESNVEEQGMRHEAYLLLVLQTFFSNYCNELVTKSNALEISEDSVLVDPTCNPLGKFGYIVLLLKLNL